MVGSRRASMVLPHPGGPVRSRWWPPAAVISSARRAVARPRTSARSTGSTSRSSGSGGGGSGSGQGCSPLRQARRSPSVRCRADVEAGDERRLVRVGRRDDDGPDPAAGERVREDERAGHRTDRAVEPELAEHADAVEASRGKAFLALEQPERDRELEPRAGLAHGRGGEVDGDALQRPRDVARQEGGAHTLARFAPGRVGEPDHVCSRGAHRRRAPRHPRDDRRRRAASRCERSRARSLLNTCERH